MSVLFNMPPAASDYARRVDVLLETLAGTTVAVAAAVIVLAVVFSIRYRRARPSRPRPPGDPPLANPPLETTWIVIPLLIFLGFYVWGARLYFAYASTPSNPLEIYVVAKQWVWTLEHRNGRREINTLHVPRGSPVRLIMTSQDVIHSFFVPALRIKRDVLPGRYETLQFTAKRDGEYHLFCAEFCGTDHARMGGEVIVMEPADYGRWLQAGGVAISLADRGEVLFRQAGCSGCHAAGSSVHAPSLSGLFGGTVPLANGSFVRFDERYVRDSILQPASEIAAGFPDAMPSYAGRLSDEQLLELIEYVKSLPAGKGSAGP